MKDSAKILTEVHNLQAEAMLAVLRSGEEISPQMFNAITKFLADNGIDCESSTTVPVHNLMEALQDAYFDPDLTEQRGIQPPDAAAAG